MLRKRVIPTLLLTGERLVKTRRFAEPIYVGDPVNTLRIFNDKEVDEIAVLDIDCARRTRPGPNLAYLERLCGECFMPLSYGGGVTDIETMKALYRMGVEKVILTTAAFESPDLVRRAVDAFGSSSVVGGVDVRQAPGGNSRVALRGGTVTTDVDPLAHAEALQKAGVGEIILNSIDRDGMMEGYDWALLESARRRLDVPLVALGGAGSVADLRRTLGGIGLSAAAAGSLFVFYGPHRAVLITYPNRAQIHGT